MDWLQNIEVVLFDLDGTLYQDRSFYKRYLELLFEKSEHEASVSEFLEEAAALLEGKHTSGVGEWYHPSSDSWTRGSDLNPVHRDWKGQEMNVSGSSNHAQTAAMYAGDAWSIVSVFASRYGIDEQRRQQAFQQVRKEMLQGASDFEHHHGLYDAIGNLSGVRSKKLLTNSPENTGSEFIAALGCGSLFSEIVYGAGKPSGLESYMQHLMDSEGLKPEQILSIGDHAWNDLYPVQKLGGRTVWISAYPSTDPMEWDVNMSTLDELAALLVELQNVKQNVQDIKGGIVHDATV